MASLWYVGKSDIRSFGLEIGDLPGAESLSFGVQESWTWNRSNNWSLTVGTGVGQIDSTIKDFILATWPGEFQYSSATAPRPGQSQQPASWTLEDRVAKLEREQVSLTFDNGEDFDVLYMSFNNWSGGVGHTGTVNHSPSFISNTFQKNWEVVNGLDLTALGPWSTDGSPDEASAKVLRCKQSGLYKVSGYMEATLQQFAEGVGTYMEWGASLDIIHNDGAVNLTSVFIDWEGNLTNLGLYAGTTPYVWNAGSPGIGFTPTNPFLARFSETYIPVPEGAVLVMSVNDTSVSGAAVGKVLTCAGQIICQQVVGLPE